MNRVIVVKIGGSTLGNHDTALDDLVSIQGRGDLPVVVHGGGNVVTQWLERLNVPVSFVRGRRVTDAKTLEVVIAVLAGLVNKELVAALESRGGRALGLTGIDGGLFEAEMQDPDMGYVGEVVKVNTRLLEATMRAGYIPVIAPLGLGTASEAAEEDRPVLNLNADTVAGEIAAALSADRLVFLTNVAGVSDASGALVSYMSPEEAKTMVAGGVASGGMIPKIEACLRALSTVSATRIIDGRVPHALLNEMEGQAGGTTIA